MKDLVIKSSVVKKELKIWLILFIAAFLINIYAIIDHSGEWIELITQLHIVILLTMIIYSFIGVIRGIFYGISNLLYQKKNQ